MDDRTVAHGGRRPCRYRRRRSVSLIFTGSLAVALVAVSGAAWAQSARPDARQMTCGELQQLVRKSGQVVVTTGQFTYQRFVANRGYCDYFETVRQDYVATSDTDVCPVSYVCERRLELFGN